MSKQYIQRLIGLAAEVKRLMEPVDVHDISDEEIERMVKNHAIKLESKINYLIGYIDALSGLEDNQLNKFLGGFDERRKESNGK